MEWPCNFYLCKPCTLITCCVGAWHAPYPDLAVIGHVMPGERRCRILVYVARGMPGGTLSILQMAVTPRHLPGHSFKLVNPHHRLKLVMSSNPWSGYGEKNGAVVWEGGTCALNQPGWVSSDNCGKRTPPGSWLSVRARSPPAKRERGGDHICTKSFMLITVQLFLRVGWNLV